jgi:hypothetical protein
MPKKGKPTRPITSAGVIGKQFQRLVKGRRIQALPAHPLVVTGDLRAGSLRSLDAYLKRHRGMPDNEVALELRKLLSGSPAESKFRLVVVDHPDLPSDDGGRPESKSDAPTRAERELYAEYLDQLEIIGKTKDARLQTAKNKRRSEITVRRAINKVEVALKKESEWEDILSRREAALNRLRTER